jgi:hypothetical protein
MKGSAAVAERTALQRIKVACTTCGVSESFYSNLSVEKFKARHSGHDAAAGNEQVMSPKEREEEGTPEERKPSEGGASTNVAKMVVDLLSFPSLDSPIVRVRGFDANLDEAFTVALSLSESAKVREMLAGGEFFDRDASGQLYAWKPDVIEYMGEVKDKLELASETQAEAGTAQPSPDASESEEAIDQATVASASEVLIDALSMEDAGSAGDGTVFESVSPPSGPSKELEDVAPTSPRPVQERPPKPESTPVRIPSPRAATSPAAKRSIEKASNAADAPSEEANEDGCLLVSKSWYIQGGKGNRNEAVRISNVLKAFRWKVEPIYTIGVILDDMLSIETSRSQMSGTLIRRIEGAGYRLTAVAIDRGKPTAWFKKEGSEISHLRAGSTAASVDYSEIELETDLTR